MKTQKTHWLKNDDKKYIGAWDLPETEDLILTIDRAGWETVVNPKNNSKESKRVIHFKEQGYKPMIVNEVNSLSIIQSTGIKYMEDMNGAKIKLYKIEDKFFGELREAIRVRKTKVVVNKPELTPSHPKWNGAKNSDLSIEELRKHFKITDENFKLLRDE